MGRFYKTRSAALRHIPAGVRSSSIYLAGAGDSDEQRYLNALKYGDRALGELRSGLRDRGLDGNTLYVVFGDHGEAFGQHDGNFGHTFFVYDENVHVPYVIAAPGLIEDKIRIPSAASLIDTAPTILDLLGLDVPEKLQGTSLL